MTDTPDRLNRHRRLTGPMRDALRAARSQPLRRVHDDRPGKPAWPANANTLHALVREGLLARSERLSRKRHLIEEWAITDAGREALEPKHRVRVGRDMVRVPGGTTRPMQLGVWQERRIPEPDKLKPGAVWAEHGAAVRSAARHAVIDDRLRPLTPEERYAELREMARNGRVDVRDDERVIERRLDAMEAKVRASRAAA